MDIVIGLSGKSASGRLYRAGKSLASGACFLLNALDPNRMTADERLAEAAELLARGLVRLRAKQSSGLSRAAESSSVDFTADQSGHGSATHFAEHEK